MGVLDDAIREHLDLKRRRGADPTEVERDERDALGPVRRTPESVPGGDAVGPASEEAADDAEVHEPEPEDLESVPVAYEPTPAAPVPEPALDQEAESWSYEDVASDPQFPAPDALVPAEPPAAPLPHPPPGATGGETEEYDALGPEPRRESAEGEDVLEETPEFLQDTPDHDRLWFEQRPPKDFDFDG